MAAWQRGNLDEARSYLDRCLQGVRRAEGHEWRTLAPMNPSGMPFSAGSTWSTWIDLLSEETWILLRSVDRHSVEAYTLAHLGSLARCQGDFALARSLQEEAERLFEQQDDREGMAQIAGQLGNVARVEGDYAAARAHLRESLRLRRALGDRRGIIMAVNNLGLLAVSEGDFARAKELYARSYAYGQKYGDVSALIMVLQQQVHLASITDDFQFAQDLNQRWFDLKRELAGSAIDYALVHAWLGEIALKRGDTAAARASYAESLVNFVRVGNSDAATTIRTILADLDARATEQSHADLPGVTGS
jgi:tetratricopeptide (TPR) repeat protein